MKQNRIIKLLMAVFFMIVLMGCENNKIDQEKVSIKEEDTMKINQTINDVILDGKIMIIVPTNEEEENEGISNYANGIKEMIENNLNVPVEIIDDKDALESDLSEYSIMAYGTVEGNKFLNEFKDQFKFNLENDYVEIDNEKFDGIGYRVIAVTQNPHNKSKGMIVYTAQSDKSILDINNINHGQQQYHVFKQEELVVEGMYKRELSDEDWIADVEFLYEELPKRHKNLFHNISKDEFKNDIDALKEKIVDLSEEEKFVEISRVVASVGDGHTRIKPNTNIIFPFQSYWFKEGIYILSTVKEYEEILGKRIVSINDISIEKIIEDMKDVISHENEASIKAAIPNYIQNYIVLKGMEIVKDKEMTLTVEEEDGSLKEVSIEALKIGNITNDNIIAIQKKIPLYLTNKNKGYWYTYLKEENILYFNYGICRDMEWKSVKDITHELIKFLDNNDVDKLVVDMRNNGGGNSSLLDSFINKISNSKMNKKGKLFVVVGRNTFSSAILNTLKFYNETEALFYGENTAGKPNHYGEVRAVSLPNSGWSISYSTKYFKNYKEDVESFEPEILVEPEFKEFIKGEDNVLKSIIQYK